MPIIEGPSTSPTPLLPVIRGDSPGKRSETRNFSDTW